MSVLLNHFVVHLKLTQPCKSTMSQEKKHNCLVCMKASDSTIIMSKKFCIINWFGNGTPLQHSCLENPMDGGAWQAAVYGVAQIRTQLSDFTFTFHFHALEKEMATHSSVLAWRIPGMGVTLVGCRLWGHTESDMTEATQQQQEEMIKDSIRK